MRWLCLPLTVFGRDGLAHKAGHKQIHNRDVDNLANPDVKSPPAVQLANVWEYQGQRREVLPHPGMLVLVTFATECWSKTAAAGAAEVLQNLDNGIRATACCPHPPCRARTQARFATLLVVRLA